MDGIVSGVRTLEPAEIPCPHHAPEGVLTSTTKAQSEHDGDQGGLPSWPCRWLREKTYCVSFWEKAGAVFIFFFFPSLQRCVGPSMSLYPRDLWLTTWRGKMPLFSATSPRRDGRTACWPCAGSLQAPTPRRP